jgi:hypothetical protein
VEVAEPPHAVRVKYAGFTRGKRQLLLPRSRASNRPHRGRGGNAALWFMNGGTIVSTATLGNFGTSWTVQSLNAE